MSAYGDGNGDGASVTGFAFTLPPHNIEVERWLISSLLLDNGLWDEPAVQALKADDFYREAHAAMFRGIASRLGAGSRVDAAILAHDMESRGELDPSGGAEHVAEIVNSAPSPVNGRYHAEIVRQLAIHRQVGIVCDLMKREAWSRQHTAERLLEMAEAEILAIRDAEAKGETVRVESVMAALLDAIDMRSRGEVTGLASGLAELDDVLTGFQPENLIYLAGRTSMGKTSLAVNIAEHVAVNMDRPLLFVSLEMSRQEIGERLLVSRSGVDGHRVRTGRLSRDETERLWRSAGELRDVPMFIDDTPGRTVGQIVANARRLRAREAIQMVVVDLINHIEGDDPRSSRREQMCVISRRLKAMARELSVPVLVLAQLNRGPDQREGNRPRKSDLKECGNLEEDADVVLLLHRPEYYDPNDRPGQALVIVDKNRNGPTRDVPVAFAKHLMRFDTLESRAGHEFIPPPADF